MRSPPCSAGTSPRPATAPAGHPLPGAGRGQRDRWAFANDEAIAAYTEALAVATADGDADAGARLQAKLANVLWRTARLDETRAAFTEALRLAGPASPSRTRSATAHLLTRLGGWRLADRRYDAAGRGVRRGGGAARR